MSTCEKIAESYNNAFKGISEFRKICGDEFSSQTLKLNRVKLVPLMNAVKAAETELKKIAVLLPERRVLAKKLNLIWVSRPIDGLYEGARRSGEKLYFNESGKTVRDYEYLARRAPDGLHRIQGLYDRYGFIDKSGKKIPADESTWFTYVNLFSEGFARVNHGGRVGFIDKAGNKIPADVNEWFDAAGDFHEGFAWVRNGNNYAYLTKDGRVVPKDPGKRFTKAGDFYNGFAEVSKYIESGLFDKNGTYFPHRKRPKKKIEKKEAGLPRLFNEDGKYYFRKNNGHVFPEMKADRYDKASEFKEDFALVEKNGERYYIDKLGKRFP